jgi:TRAP-type mannitol/chloroaromatic compound transport system permease small subunit
MVHKKMRQTKVHNILQSIDFVNELSGKIAGYLFIPLSIIIFMEVILRYIFRSPTIWAWDLSVQLYAGILMLAGGYTLLRGGHVSVDVLTGLLSTKWRAILDLITAPFCFITAVVLIWYGSIVAWESFQMGERMSTMWQPLFWPVKMLIPLGGGLLLIQGIAKFVRDLAYFNSAEGK